MSDWQPSLNKQQQNENVQIRTSIKSQSNKKPINSQHFQEYCTFMDNLSQAIPQELILRLNKNCISYFPDWPAQIIEIKAKSYINNMQILEVQVVLAYFSGTINILNVETQSKIHTACEHKIGGYGRVYRIKHDNWVLALKCISFKEENFATVFKNTLAEYFVMKIASILEVGPMIKPPFGFDIIIYRNCLEFTMEFCPCIEKDSLESDLKIALSKLHVLRLIHYDIKPQNINFSHYFNKYIFLDFGLSKAINESIGFKSLTSFRGSLMFCGSQMESLYITKQERMIDLYFNDAECLRKSLLYFSQMHQYIESQGQMNHNLIDMTLQYQLFNIKWKFYKFLAYPNANPSIINSISKNLIERYALNIAEFINFFPKQQSKMLDFYYRHLFQYKSSNFSKKFTINLIQNQCFFHRFQIIDKINNTPKLDFRNFIHNTQAKKKIVTEIQRYAAISKEKCRLKIVEFIRVQDNNNPIELKVQIANIFLKLQGKQIDIGECSIKFALGYIVDTIINNPLDRYTMVTLESIIISLFFYQVKAQDKMLQFFNSLLSMDCSLTNKFMVILKFFISIKWIQNKHISQYDCQALQESIFYISQQFIQRTDFNSAEPNQKLLLQIVKKIIAQKASNSSLKAIKDIINSIKYDRLLILNISFLSIIYIYVQLRQLQFVLQNGIQMCNLLLNVKYQLICQSQKRCSISICLFSKLHLYEYYMSINRLIKKISYKFTKLYENYPQIKHYHLFVFHKLHHFMQKKVAEKQVVLVFDEIMKKSSYLQKIFMFSNLIKVYVNKKRERSQFIGMEMMNFIKQNILALILVSYDKKEQKFHKHKIITIIKGILQIFHLLIDFQFFKGEDMKIMIIKSSNQFMSCIKQQKCLKCKALSLVELHFLQSYIQILDKRYEKVLEIYLDITICALKYNQMHENILNFLNIMLIFAQNSKIQDNMRCLVQLFCEMVAKQRTYLFFFSCDQDGYERLADVYLYLLWNGRIDQLKYMLQIILAYICENYSQHYAIGLLNALLAIRQRTNNIEIQLFYNNHQQIIQYFKKKPFNPFIGYYFAILIPFNLEKNHKASTLYKIAESINFLDNLCKNIILSLYYLSFLHHTTVNKRKRLYLKKMHSRHNFLKKVTFEQLVKIYRKRCKRHHRKQIFEDSLNKCIYRYYGCLQS